MLEFLKKHSLNIFKKGLSQNTKYNMIFLLQLNSTVMKFINLNLVILFIKPF